ncbi:MAG: protein kinase [Gemmatimonadetes bacterium]|nr:protein kinase [Gemmatimonadota bacterium]
MSDPESFTRLQVAMAPRYRIERELGRGGMATVYIAEDLKHGRRVAIKILKPELSERLGRERFLREISLVAKLSHPNVLPLYDSGDADGLLYHVTPYVAGESLRDRVDREQQLPVDDALQITREVADALAYAHGFGIVHRDIKPENILLEAGHAVVTDFGIALALSAAGGARLTETGIAVGTPLYMSPEQAAGESQIDARADVYALACVLYEMLAGVPPYTGPNARAILARKLSEPPPGLRVVRDTVPPGIERAVMRGLAGTPADRFPSALAFAEALAAPADAPAVSPSIAVLPFVSMSADPDNEYFADGVTEDVITQLAKLRGLKVISRTSVMQFKNHSQSLREVGAKLGVATVLEGSVRRSTDRIRIVAQLIDVATDAHLWADTYDRELEDVFAIQSDVALRIASALQAEISPDEKARIRRKPTVDLEAYHLYLKGRYSSQRFTSDGIDRGIEYYEEAIRRDPGYALAYVGLGLAYVASSMGYGGGSVAPDVAYRRARASALRALEIDDDLGDAHFISAFIKYAFEFTWTDAEEEFRRAFELSPGSDFAHDAAGLMFAALERWDEALEHLGRARELDPLVAAHVSSLATVLLRAGRVDECIAEAHKLLELHPDFPNGHAVLGWAHILKDEADRGIAELERAVSLVPDNPMFLAQLGQAYGMVGEIDEAHRILRQVQDMSRQRHVSSYHLAYVYTGLGEKEKAIDCLEEAYAERAGGLYGVKGSFLFRTLHGHPRFTRLMRKMNLEETP